MVWYTPGVVLGVLFCLGLDVVVCVDYLLVCLFGGRWVVVLVVCRFGLLVAGGFAGLRCFGCLRVCSLLCLFGLCCFRLVWMGLLIVLGTFILTCGCLVLCYLRLVTDCWASFCCLFVPSG